MNDLLFLFVGVAVGAYFSDEIHNVAPILNKSKAEQ